MRKVLPIFILISVAAFLSSCSGGADGNAVQVGNGDTGSLSNAEIPSEFPSAADALATGNQLFDAGETAKAIDVWLQAVKMDPNLAEAYFKLGIAYALVEAQDTAVENSNTDVQQPDAKKSPAKKKNSEKAFESAVEAYKKVLADNKDDDAAHFYLGLTYNKLNEDEDAAKELREAVKLKPDNTEYQTELGAIYIKLAKYHEAVAALKKAIEADPDNIDAQEMLEKAEAGQKRVDFSPPPKDGKQPSGSNSNANSAANTNEKPAANSNADSGGKPPVKPAKTPPLPTRTPR